MDVSKMANPLASMSNERWAAVSLGDKKMTFEAIAKYGDNKWWLSEDPKTVARYQMFEPVLLVDFQLFKEGVGQFLGREIYTHDLIGKKIKEELRQAIKAHDEGTFVPPTAEDVRNKFLDSANYVKELRNGKDSIIVPPGTNPKLVEQKIRGVLRSQPDGE